MPNKIKINKKYCSCGYSTFKDYVFCPYCSNELMMKDNSILDYDDIQPAIKENIKYKYNSKVNTKKDKDKIDSLKKRRLIKEEKKIKLRNRALKDKPQWFINLMNHKGRI